MDKVVLKATKRTLTGKQVSQLRRKGELPAVIYGHNVGSMPITLNAHDAFLALGRLTSSSLITISVDGQEYSTLVRERQKDYIKNRLTHVDFMAVSLTEKLRASVRIELTGTSIAVKDFNAVLVNGLNELSVECFPQDLPERVTVDVSALNQIGDGIYVRDVVVSEKVRVLNGPDDMIVVATAPKVEEVEVAAPVVGVEGAEPEVIEKGKKEEEGAEEGAPAEDKEKK